ncbi:hypothetical protein POVWA2_095960 [Plasmodium ovale wallikeri]|uniref:PIR Superfamily Protein n=1 Tax=Plasmodium ovale wallikeri TaxID=864142 RepID=A0A1A9AT23_PLAOA|nr:hypothetical protein POVWA1_076810 [Plasmodium ovale wallikeri]SBT59405.1 hypothetical protein POVWA2_095960 [Plasmodium ovale wallikeri]
MKGYGAITRGFKKENLPSNEYKKELCTNEKIRNLEERTSYVSDYELCEQTIKDFFTELSINHHVLKTNCNKENGLKCCRDVNYYLDYATGIFKSSILNDSDKNKLIKNVKEIWEPTLRAKDIYTCERPTDLDSTRKRCILQHLYDLKEDEKSMLSFEQIYKEHLSEKWKKIISYTDTQPSSLFVKIENNSMGIVENYANFLHSSDYICGNDLDKLSDDDIKISTDMNDFLSSISLDKISLNFSPFGSLLRRFTKKKIEVDENANDEILDSYENTENERSYISYHSTSH